MRSRQIGGLGDLGGGSDMLGGLLGGKPKPAYIGGASPQAQTAPISQGPTSGTLLGGLLGDKGHGKGNLLGGLVRPFWSAACKMNETLMTSCDRDNSFRRRPCGLSCCLVESQTSDMSCRCLRAWCTSGRHGLFLPLLPLEQREMTQ